MVLVKFNDKQKNQTLFDIWKKSYEELDETTHQLFTNHMRIHLNRMILRKVGNYVVYEKERYGNRHRNHLVIAEFFCLDRKIYFIYKVIKVLSYISYCFTQKNETVERILKNLKCTNCQGNRFQLTMVI